MSMVPLSGITGSAAGAPLSQTAGSETERAQKDSSSHQRKVDKDTKAENAAGIGQTEEDQGTDERDADGRRFWEDTARGPADEADEADAAKKQSKDPTGDCGNSLDLTG